MENPIAHVMLSWQPRRTRRTEYQHVDNYLDALGRLFNAKEIRNDLEYKG